MELRPRRGRTADVAALLAGGADVNEPSTDTLVVTALWVACQQGHIKVVTTLLAANANPDQAMTCSAVTPFALGSFTSAPPASSAAASAARPCRAASISGVSPSRILRNSFLRLAGAQKKNLG